MTAERRRMESAPYAFIDLSPQLTSFRDEILAGLASPRKRLPSKYFYDARGSELFEQICALPEYYPTRTEMQIMQRVVPEIARSLGPDCALIEYGSGSGAKTRVLLQALHPVAYVPIDIAAAQLKDAAAHIARAFAAVRVVAVCADYTRPLVLPALEALPARRRVVYFSGSTIGNFTPQEAREFLGNARTLVARGGAMLIGVDLKKDAASLHAAYNDSQGITAEFNLNLLERINRELQADFRIAAFAHHAVYNADEGRIEMHLVSRCDQRVKVSGRAFDFREGETIHTENSYKYSVEEFQALARSAGFAAEAVWVDPLDRFSVHLLVAER